MLRVACFIILWYYFLTTHNEVVAVISISAILTALHNKSVSFELIKGFIKNKI